MKLDEAGGTPSPYISPPLAGNFIVWRLNPLLILVSSK